LKIARQLGLFVLGGGSYVGLELLWRRRSHVSMFAAGGISFLLLGTIRESRLPNPVKPAAGAGMITLVELVTGLLVNRDHHVWDYRSLPLNYRGQICLPFSLLWIPVSSVGMGIHRLTEICGKYRTFSTMSLQGAATKGRRRGNPHPLKKETF